MMRVRLDLMEVGSCRHPACMVTGRPGLASIRFPALVARITHPTRGIFLFDTGYGGALDKARDPVARAYRRLLPYRLEPGQACLHQLQAAGIDRGDVRGIILSHLHPDHAGGLLDFPGIPVHLSRDALATLDIPGLAARARLGLIADLFPADLAARALPVESCLTSTVSGWPLLAEGADLLGDGSLIALPLPGHAPGHIGLRLVTESGREVLLAGDAAWLSVAIRDGLEPLAPARAFLHDYPAYRRTLLGLQALGRARPDLAIVPSHCADAIQALRHELG